MGKGKGRSKENRKEATALMQVRDGGGLAIKEVGQGGNEEQQQQYRTKTTARE